MVGVAQGFSAGAAVGLKAPLDDTAGDGYEIAVGVLATYAPSSAALVGASWIHGKLLGGSAALPAGTSGIDSRACHVWITATH